MPSKVEKLGLPDVVLLTPHIHMDSRGRFVELHRSQEIPGIGDLEFRQSSVSHSVSWALRGIYYQQKHPQGNLLRCLHGEAFCVAVDLRKGSPSFGKWCGAILSYLTMAGLWVPPGMAYGYLVMSQPATLYCESTAHSNEKDAKTIKWDDPDIGIRWPLPAGRVPVLSLSDARASSFRDAEAVLI